MLLCGVITQLEAATFYFQLVASHWAARGTKSLSCFLHAKSLLVRICRHLLKMVPPCLLANPFSNVRIAALKLKFLLHLLLAALCRL